MEWESTTTIVGLMAAIVGVAIYLKQAKLETAEAPEQLPPSADAAVALLFMAAGSGYRLLEVEPRALTAGSILHLEGQAYVVARLGPAPLPTDSRRCAYVEPSGARLTASGDGVRDRAGDTFPVRTRRAPIPVARGGDKGGTRVARQGNRRATLQRESLRS